MKNTQLIPQEIIEKKIFLIRGQKVMLDLHIAELYEVETKALKRAVRRNIDRFPDDFVFELNAEEYNSLRSHFGTLKRGEHSKYLPFAFTEQGVSMLSSVLRSQRAVQVNVAIMRTFVRLRELISSHKELLHKLEELERKIESHDSDIQIIFEAIHKLMEPEFIEEPKQQIGFRIEEPRHKYSVHRKRRK